MQATEEAVANALVANEDMTGRDGHRTPALPRDRVAALLRAGRRRGRAGNPATGPAAPRRCLPSSPRIELMRADVVRAPGAQPQHDDDAQDQPPPAATGVQARSRAASGAPTVQRRAEHDRTEDDAVEDAAEAALERCGRT